MSKTLPAEGTILAIQPLATGTYTTIGGVTTIDPGEQVVAPIPYTALADTIKKKRPSRQPDMGTASFHVNYDPNDATVHAVIRTRTQPQAGGAATPTDGWKLTYNDGDTTAAFDTFQGFVSKWKTTGLEEDGNLGADVEITLTSAITSTAGVP